MLVRENTAGSVHYCRNWSKRLQDPYGINDIVLAMCRNYKWFKLGIQTIHAHPGKQDGIISSAIVLFSIL